MQKNVKLLTYTALMTAFVFVTTSIVKIPVPFTNGYIHAGDMSIFVGAILLGPTYGAILAGLGSAMADFFGGYAQWVLPTLIVKAIMGYFVGALAHSRLKGKSLSAILILFWFAAMIGLSHFVSQTPVETIAGAVEDVSDATAAAALAVDFHRQIVVIGVLVPAIAIIMAVLSKHFAVKPAEIIGIMLGGIWMVIGYYFAAGIMYGSMIAAIFSIPWNIIQFIGGGALAFIILNALKPTGIRAHIDHELKK
ncbi:ECF transporter S component [Fusibacter paucivorans]|uniref:ECF transporter S component n=1 Tax=Fusibacter paucivorans TaxID=76009 RepID=A0ABS5PPV8_9FIRM|nr:ECF transporter S component [Fusibacter paucivorans]MBS7526429.1 ECF transporter S component [Fusibacter paucivorans]